MLDFACPSCGTRVQGDDSFAGKLVVCPAGGQAVTMRRADQRATGITDAIPTFPANSGDPLPTKNAPMPSIRKAIPHIAVRLSIYVVVIVLVVTAVGLLTPGVRFSQESAART